MGASNFTYAEASWTQALADWIGAHTRAFAALGGVPKLLVPDNTKSLPSRKRGWLSSRPVSRLALRTPGGHTHRLTQFASALQRHHWHA